MWLHAPDGYLDLSAVFRQLAAWRPVGFDIVVIDGQYAIDPEVVMWRVNDGALLRVQLRPEQHWLQVPEAEEQPFQGPDNDPPEPSNGPGSGWGADILAQAGDFVQRSSPRQLPPAGKGGPAVEPTSCLATCSAVPVLGHSGSLRWRFLALLLSAWLQPNKAVQIFDLRQSAPTGGYAPTTGDRVDKWQVDILQHAPPLEPPPDTSVLSAVPQAKAHTGVVPHTGSVSQPPLPRPVPTPCRSAVSPLHVGVLLELHTPPGLKDTELQCPPVTLLEECARCKDFRGFFLARTLLETLEDHFQSQAVPLGKTEPRALHLDGRIPLSIFQQQALELAALLPAADPEPHTLDWLDRDISFLLADVQVPPHKRNMLQQIKYWRDADDVRAAQSLVVYTDGSAPSPDTLSGDLTCGAWAATVWVRTDQGLHFLGHALACVQSPDSPYHIGELDDTPLTCEVLGIAWALAWIMEHGGKYNLPMELRYDCTTAGRGTFAAARLAYCAHVEADYSLASFAVFLRQCAQQRSSLCHRHVPGHQGDVGNELCDELAKLCRRRKPDVTEVCLPTWPQQVFRHPLKPWLWPLRTTSPDVPTLFALESEACRMQSQPRYPTHGPRLGKMPTCTPKERVRHEFTLVSFNVLTLLDPGAPGKNARMEGLKVSAKRDVLKSQLAHMQVLLCGIQETRLIRTEMLPDADYWMLHSAAGPDGHHGVALWISKKVPYAQHGQRQWCFAKDHCTVVDFSARHLVVQLNAPLVNWTVLVAHGPSEPPAPAGTAKAFWQQCRVAVSRRPRSSELIILTDANAHLGEVSSPSVGPQDPEPETSSGEAFHTFLAQHDLYAPSTFVEAHSGPSYTWIAPSGTAHRLDYIGVPLAWPMQALQSRVHYQFESLQLRSDHHPVVLRCSIDGRHPDDLSFQESFQRRAIRPQVSQPDAAYTSAMESAQRHPLLRWDTPVDAHFEQLVHTWSEAGRSLCGPRRPAPRQAYVQDDTLALVRYRRGLREALATTHQELKRLYLRVSFAALLGSLRSADPAGVAGRVGRRGIRGLHYRLALLTQALEHAGHAIRKMVKRDRAHYLAGIVSQVEQADIRDPKHLFRVVRKAFPSATSKRRQAFQPLPAIQDSEGCLAVDRDHRREVWRKHFAALEDGEPILEA